ncbi:MAG: hypothetical protein WCI76_02515 [bacterium]
MGIFSHNKEKGKLVLVFYIGSSSVGGALFLTQKSGIPKIIFSVREPISLEKDIEAGRFFTLTIQALNLVVSTIHKSGLGAPSEIYCVLSSLWYVSQTRIVKLEKNTPFIFNAKFADELMNKEKALFVEEYATKYANSGIKTRIIELKNIKTMMNGYETTNPLNQKALDLEMSLFISMSEEETLKKIEETIGLHFHPRGIKFFTFTFASFAVVRDMHLKNEDFLLVNIGGEVTDISMVKKNILSESVSFSLGVNFMIREVAAHSSCSLSEAKSCISLLKDDHATSAVTTKIAPIINKIKMDWLTRFQASLANLSNDISVPSTIYLSVDKELATFFEEIIRNEQFNQYTLTESKFEIIYLSTEMFHGMAVFEENVVRDLFLIMDAIYVNRFLKNPAHQIEQGAIEQI